jgi:hypothetical protein
MDKRANLREYFGNKELEAVKGRQYEYRTAQLVDLENNILTAFNALIRFLDGKTTKTEVVNQLKSISTPDVDKVVTAVSKLDKDILANKLDLKPLIKELQQIKREMSLVPKSLPKLPEQKDSIKVTNLDEVTLDTSSLEKAIKSLKLDPVIDVKTPDVHTAPLDLSPVKDGLLNVIKAIKAQKYPEMSEIPTTDLSKVEKELQKHTKQLKEIIDKPVGGGGGGGGNGTPYVDSTGKPQTVELVSGKVPIDGTLTSAPAKPTDVYSIQAISEDATYKYYFFEADDADYYIMRKHLANKVFDYTKGTGGYSTVYQDATSGPSGSPTWGAYGTTF